MCIQEWEDHNQRYCSWSSNYRLSFFCRHRGNSWDNNQWFQRNWGDFREILGRKKISNESLHLTPLTLTSPLGSDNTEAVPGWRSYAIMSKPKWIVGELTTTYFPELRQAMQWISRFINSPSHMLWRTTPKKIEQGVFHQPFHQSQKINSAFMPSRIVATPVVPQQVISSLPKLFSWVIESWKSKIDMQSSYQLKQYIRSYSYSHSHHCNGKQVNNKFQSQWLSVSHVCSSVQRGFFEWSWRNYPETVHSTLIRFLSITNKLADYNARPEPPINLVIDHHEIDSH